MTHYHWTLVCRAMIDVGLTNPIISPQWLGLAPIPFIIDFMTKTQKYFIFEKKSNTRIIVNCIILLEILYGTEYRKLLCMLGS